MDGVKKQETGAQFTFLNPLQFSLRHCTLTPGFAGATSVADHAIGRQSAHRIAFPPLFLSLSPAESSANFDNTMFLKKQLSWNVIIPSEHMDVKGLMLQRAIISRLLEDFATKKATKDLGYLLAVTTLDKIGEGRVRPHTGDVLFPVNFTALTFNIFKGEVAEGLVHRILRHGVFLRCGPIETIFLSAQKMPGYQHIPGENPMFISEKQAKIEKDVKVRFTVIGTKWVESDREFQAVISVDGDFLGPI